jgi:hypothetical protein
LVTLPIWDERLHGKGVPPAMTDSVKPEQLFRGMKKMTEFSGARKRERGRPRINPDRELSTAERAGRHRKN